MREHSLRQRRAPRTGSSANGLQHRSLASRRCASRRPDGPANEEGVTGHMQEKQAPRARPSVASRRRLCPTLL
eukprot:131497-Alexandrium_andersonii.AAC.1